MCDRAKKLAAEVQQAVRSYEPIVAAKEATRRQKEKAEIADHKRQQSVLTEEAKGRGDAFKAKVQRPEKMKGNLMNELRTFDLDIGAKVIEERGKTGAQPWLSAVVDNLSSRFPNDKIVAALDSLCN